MNLGGSYAIDDAIAGLIGIVVYVVAFFVMLIWLWVRRDKDYKPLKAGSVRQRKSKIPKEFELF